jgi:hypothetical protein
MNEMVILLAQDLDNLKTLVKIREQIYQATHSIIKELEEKDIVMKKVIQALLIEVERVEYLSDYMYEQGKPDRGLYRKNEAKQLRAIVKLMQKKT